MPLPSVHCPIPVRAAFVAALGGFWLAAAPLAPASPEVEFNTIIRPQLQKYCYECHNDLKAKSDVNLEELTDVDAFRGRAKLLDALSWVVEEHEMPPSDFKDQPTEDERRIVVEWTQRLLAEAKDANPNQPGRVVMPRLNPTEYNRVVEAITGYPIDVAGIFPREGGGGEGFSNVGEAQSATPMQVEKFLIAAKELVDHASIAGDGALTWHPKPPAVTDNSAAKLDELKKSWAALHEDIYTSALERARAAEAPFEYRFTPYIEIAFRFHHRAALGTPDATIDGVARSLGIESIPTIILEKWYRLLTTSQKSRYLDFITRRFTSLPAPGSAGLAVDNIRTEAAMMAKYLELYARQNAIDQWRPDFEAPPAWLADQKRGSRKRGRSAFEKDISNGIYRFDIDLAKAGNPEVLHLITSPAGDGAKDDLVVWDGGRFQKDGKTASWRWNDSVAFRDSTGKTARWGVHPRSKSIARDGIAVQAPNILLVPVPPGATRFEVTAQLDSSHTKQGSVQLLIDTKPPERVVELAGRMVVGPQDGANMRTIADASAAVRRAVMDDFIDENRGEVFTGYPGVDASRLAPGEARKLPASAMLPFSLTVDEVRRLANDEDAVRMHSMARQISAILTPQDPEANTTAARRLIEDFTFIAWRRPPSAEEVDRLLALYHELRQLGQPFNRALKQCLVGILVSPNFIYRIQHSRDSADPYPLNDFELASRLSFAIWGSIPDDRLIELAKSGSLREPKNIHTEVTRMLADPRADCLAENFAGHWLQFVGFEDHSAVDAERFAEFTPELRQAMTDEIRLFFSDIIRNDGSVLDILLAKHTFLNEDLAKHYGIPGVTGPEMRKVELPPDSGRRGVITMGAVLTKTSMPLRTSPVVRGDWVLERVLGVEMPAPPNDVPMLSDDETDEHGLTLLQQLAQHRDNPQCKSCHVRIDPIGLAMENFDPIGRWREETHGGLPVINTGELANGDVLDGINGLHAYLEDREDLFLNQFCRKFLGYAVGRKIGITDRPLIDTMKAALAENDHRFSTMAHIVFTSPQFLNRQDFRAAAANGAARPPQPEN